jgi:hypothetical protein
MGEEIRRNLRVAHSQGVKRINRSQFVDDALLMGGASRIISNHFKLVLDRFNQIYRGIINKNKSQIYAWNINTPYLIGIAHILQFPISDNWKYFKYLGMLICLKSLPSES